MSTITVPRPHQGRRRAFVFEGSGDINPWASDVDRTLGQVINSLGQSQRLFAKLTNQTSAATGAVALHASTHLPNGTDPLTTAAPISILGGTSSNQKGIANSYARSDHSHDVATAAHTGGYGTTAAEGSSNSLLRGDARFEYPSALMSAANSATCTFTDNGVETTLTSSLGNFILIAGGTGGLIFDTDVTPAVQTAVVRVRPANGNVTGMASAYFPGNVATAANQTVRVWDAQMNHSSGKVGDSGGGFNATLVASDISHIAAAPAAGSGTANVMYGFRCTNPTIDNATGGWAEVASLFLGGPKRLISNPTVTIAETLVLTCPVISATTQAGLYIKQQTAQQLAANRYGILIDPQNSGTAKTAISAITDPSIFGPITFDGGTVTDAKDIVLGTGTGTKIGTGTTQKLGFWGAGPVVQPAVTGTASSMVAGGGAAVDDLATFTGGIGATAYRLDDVVKNLKNAGILKT